MIANDLKEHMMRVGTWVDWNNTCDRFIIGSPDTEVTGIAVGWQARTDALKQAVEKGCNLFVTHEPVFYYHMDDNDSVFAQPHVREKRDFIEQHGIVIFRCHDVWDRMPIIGIVDSWASHLGLCDKINSNEFHSVYESPGSTLRELGQYVAERTADLRQNSVEIVGDPDAPVTKVAIGCGAITHYQTMVELGADAIIGTDDGMNYWSGGAWCLDAGVSLVLVNHATAEEPGMINLTWYMGQQFPDVPIVHIPQGCMFTTVPG